MTKLQAKMAFQAIHSAASSASSLADAKASTVQAALHDIRNMALKAIMDIDAAADSKPQS